MHLLPFALLLVFLLSAILPLGSAFSVPPRGGLCFAGALGDCKRCECSRGYNCRRGKCV